MFDTAKVITGFFFISHKHLKENAKGAVLLYSNVSFCLERTKSPCTQIASHLKLPTRSITVPCRPVELLAYFDQTEPRKLLFRPGHGFGRSPFSEPNHEATIHVSGCSFAWEYDQGSHTECWMWNPKPGCGRQQKEADTPSA